jgi:glutamate 5-kinase
MMMTTGMTVMWKLSTSMNNGRHALTRVKRVVVKVGSALLTTSGVQSADTQSQTNQNTGLALDKIADYSAQISQLYASGIEVVLVSSGAIAAGCQRLGWRVRPQAVYQLQAAAAVGQMGLAQAYETALKAHGRAAAMIVLTHDDLVDRERYLNARATLQELLALGVLPVINENDTVVTDEIRFGDNDTLAALVTNLLAADLLVILTDVDGLMDRDPRVDSAAKRISQAAADDVALDRMATAGAGVMGRGGMVTKLRASRLAARSGAHTVIAGGHGSNVLQRVLSGDDIGTLLTAELTPMTARKRWIAGQLRAKGDLLLDAGAVRAIKEQGVSLLAVGVTGVRGRFQRGEMVRLVDESGLVIAQGLTNYASDDARKLVGIRSESFAEYIDYVGEPELVHRDNLVVN